jgi:hypothetical protein
MLLCWLGQFLSFESSSQFSWPITHILKLKTENWTKFTLLNASVPMNAMTKDITKKIQISTEKNASVKSSMNCKVLDWIFGIPQHSHAPSQCLQLLHSPRQPAKQQHQTDSWILREILETKPHHDSDNLQLNLCRVFLSTVVFLCFKSHNVTMANCNMVNILFVARNGVNSWNFNAISEAPGFRRLVLHPGQLSGTLMFSIARDHVSGQHFWSLRFLRS